MYIMSYNQQPLPWQVNPNGEAAMAVDMACNLIADANNGLVFNEEEHRYYLGIREIPSVSTIVKEYAPFDVKAKALNCSKNPKHEHFGKSPEEIIAIWEEKRDASAAAGTSVHEFGEACFLVKMGRKSEVDIRYSDRFTEKGFEARTPKEEAVAKWWDDLDMQRFVPVAKELRIVNPYLEYAGTFDLLLYDLQNHFYILRDYKTNADLFKDFGQKLKAPLNIIKATDYGKYTLQQNLYKIQLENIGINIGSIELIWLLEDSSYQNVHIDDYRNLIVFAMEMRLKKS